MATYQITNHYSGESLGTYEAENHIHALALLARDAGYTSIDDMDEQTGGDARDELDVYLADTE